MRPDKRPYNSGTIRIQLLPSPSVMAPLTCRNRPVGYLPAPSFPAYFRFPKPGFPGVSRCGGCNQLRAGSGSGPDTATCETCSNQLEAPENHEARALLRPPSRNGTGSDGLEMQ
jgi:hypothetical protein